VAARVARLAGTQVGGFRLTSNRGDKGRWTALSYQLVKVSQDETTSDENATFDSETQAAAEGAAVNAQKAHDILGQAEASAPKPAATQQSEPAKPADMPPPSDPVEHLRASGAASMGHASGVPAFDRAIGRACMG